jgi:uncharacterized damage-inducible protein DinB
MPDPAGLLEVWRHEAPRTLRVVAVFEDDDLAYRPAHTTRSVGEVCGYLASSCDVTRHWLQNDVHIAFMASDTPSTVAQALQRLADGHARLFEVLSGLSAERFSDVIAPFGVAEHRGVMALGMFKHELHYRGELYALARVCRREPPDLYAAPALAGLHESVP